MCPDTSLAGETRWATLRANSWGKPSGYLAHEASRSAYAHCPLSRCWGCLGPSRICGRWTIDMYTTFSIFWGEGARGSWASHTPRKGCTTGSPNGRRPESTLSLIKHLHLSRDTCPWVNHNALWSTHRFLSSGGILTTERRRSKGMKKSRE